MQVDFNVDDLIQSIQVAAMRRGLFVAYMPAVEKWTVNKPTGEIVGKCAQIEKVLGILDDWEIVNEVVNSQWVDNHLLLHPREMEFSPRRRSQEGERTV